MSPSPLCCSCKVLSCDRSSVVTTTVKPHAAQRWHPQHHMQCDDRNRNTTCSTTTATTKPHVVQRRRQRHPRGAMATTAKPTRHNNGTHDTTCGAMTTTVTPHVAQQPQP